MEKLLSKLQILALPLSFLASVLILYLVGGPILLSRIQAARQQVAELKNEKSVLEEKLVALQNFGVESNVYSGAAANALPPANASLLAVSQLRGRASSFGVDLLNLKAAGENEMAGLYQTQLSFEVDGTLASILNFLASISTFAPLTKLEEVKISESISGIRANVTLTVYWSPFPQRLPELASPLAELTSDELETLTTLGELEAPVFSDLTPQAPSTRADPFSL